MQLIGCDGCGETLAKDEDYIAVYLPKGKMGQYHNDLDCIPEMESILASLRRADQENVSAEYRLQLIHQIEPNRNM